MKKKNKKNLTFGFLKGIFCSILLLFGVASIYFWFVSKEYYYLYLGIISIVISWVFLVKVSLFERKISLTAFFKRIYSIKKGTKNELKGQNKKAFRGEVEKKGLLLLILLFVYLIIHSIVSGLLTIGKLNFPSGINQSEPIYLLYLKSIAFEFSKVSLYEILPILAVFVVGVLILIRSWKKNFPVKVKLFEIFLFSLLLLSLYFVGNYTSLLLGKGLISYEVSKTSSLFGNEERLKDLNVLTKQEEIVERLRKMNITPKILGESERLKATVLQTIISSRSNKQSFYKQILLPSVISKKKFDFKIPADIFMLPDDTLVFLRINKDTIEFISPSLGRLMVRQQFEQKYIKEEPKMQLMGRQEYLKYREDQINQQIKEIEGFISETIKLINSYYGYITQDKQKIEANKSGISESIQKRDSSYNYCKTAGYYSYYFGIFYRYYSDAECDTKRSEWDNIINQYQKNISDWERSLQEDQSALKEYQANKELLENYRDLVASQKDTTPNELGLFESPDKIKVVLESTDSDSLADYLSVLAHEFLHYSSYVSEERELSKFFEEGITEYLSRKILNEQVHTKINVGYPLLVPVIEKIANDISEDSLREIYFTKNEKLLIGLLNQKYGEKFYTESEYYFDIIPWLSGTEALEMVNNILLRIDGKQLEEKDLYSSESKLN